MVTQKELYDYQIRVRLTPLTVIRPEWNKRNACLSIPAERRSFEMSDTGILVMQKAAWVVENKKEVSLREAKKGFTVRSEKSGFPARSEKRGFIAKSYSSDYKRRKSWQI